MHQLDDIRQSRSEASPHCPRRIVAFSIALHGCIGGFVGAGGVDLAVNRLRLRPVLFR